MNTSPRDPHHFPSGRRARATHDVHSAHSTPRNDDTCKFRIHKRRCLVLSSMWPPSAKSARRRRALPRHHCRTSSSCSISMIAITAPCAPPPPSFPSLPSPPPPPCLPSPPPPPSPCVRIVTLGSRGSLAVTVLSCKGLCAEGGGGFLCAASCRSPGAGTRKLVGKDARQVSKSLDVPTCRRTPIASRNCKASLLHVPPPSCLPHPATPIVPLKPVRHDSHSGDKHPHHSLCPPPPTHLAPPPKPVSATLTPHSAVLPSSPPSSACPPELQNFALVAMTRNAPDATAAGVCVCMLGDL